MQVATTQRSLPRQLAARVLLVRERFTEDPPRTDVVDARADIVIFDTKAREANAIEINKRIQPIRKAFQSPHVQVLKIDSLLRGSLVEHLAPLLGLGAAIMTPALPVLQRVTRGGVAAGPAKQVPI